MTKEEMITMNLLLAIIIANSEAKKAFDAEIEKRLRPLTDKFDEELMESQRMEAKRNKIINFTDCSWR